MGKLSLAARKNIKDAKVDIENGPLKRINDATGVEWTVDIDYEALEDAFAADPEKKDYCNRSGEVSLWYLEGLANNIESFVQKDEMYKEALIEEVTSKTIKGIKIEGSDFYTKVALEDGALVIVVAEGKLTANVDDCGRDLVELF